MRKYLGIPLTLIVSANLTMAMLWLINQPPFSPNGRDKVEHLIVFAVLIFLRTHTAFFWTQRKYTRLNRGYPWYGSWSCFGASISPTSQTSRLVIQIWVFGQLFA